jgi:hypothetical protein
MPAGRMAPRSGEHICPDIRMPAAHGSRHDSTGPVPTEREQNGGKVNGRTATLRSRRTLSTQPPAVKHQVACVSPK